MSSKVTKEIMEELDSILTEMEQPFALFNFLGTRVRQRRLEKLKDKLEDEE